METKREKGKLVDKEDLKDTSLKEITLSDDSNLILPEVDFPSTYQIQGDVKYGAKYRASEQDLVDYRKRVSRDDAILTPDEIKTLVSDTNERRRALEQSIAEQKEQFKQKRTAELQARHIKQREESRAHRIANENDTQREMRIAAEEELKTGRVREIQALQNKCKKEKEEVTVFFEQSSGRFSSKYGNATKRVSGDTGIDRIISSRTFSTGRFAHRCIVCGYHYQESLSISKIYQHIYENKDQHIQIALSEIDKTYNTLLADTRKKHAVEDNPDLKQQRLSRELEGLSKLKGAKYR
jgi:hypothetical protein